MSTAEFRKRPQSSPPLPWQRPTKDHRRRRDQISPRDARSEHPGSEDLNTRKEQETFAREQTRLNQIQEAEQMREWVSREDDFVLQQSKKKAHIRVKEGRAKPIDWLAVTLGIIDTTRDPLDLDTIESDIDVVDPAGVFEGLTLSELQDLGRDIDTYTALESDASNRRYWNVRRG